MKLKYINSLKGICCLIVFTGHMISLLMPYVYFGETYPMHTATEESLFKTPLNLFFNAPSALMCFLLLSGFLVPLSAFKTDQGNVLVNWWKRYLRLMPMVVIGCVLGWLVMKAGLVYSLKAIDITYAKNYTEWFNNFEPGKLIEKNGPIYDGMIGSFLDRSLYNAPLGTIKFIWINSFVLLIINKFCSKLKVRYIIYGILICLSYMSGRLQYENFYVGIMLLGMLLCDVFYNPLSSGKRLPVPMGIICMIAGVYLASVPKGSPGNGIYSWIVTLPITHYLYWAIGWSFIVIAIESVSGIRRFLENRVFLWLGDVSFAIFAVHWPVVVSVSCAFLLGLLKINGMSYAGACCLVVTVTIAIVIGVSWIVQNKIYKYLCKFVNRIVEKLEK